MKLALLLFGISLEINKYWQYGTLYSVDYKNSYENYRKYIFEYFKNKGYEIDVYISTNILPDINKQDLLNKYKPIKSNFIETIEDDIQQSKNSKMNDVVNLCITEGIEYDIILITRIDLLFQKEFDSCNIILDKFNIVNILEDPHYICDNFYLFPYKYLAKFSTIIKSENYLIKKNLENIGFPINYILTESSDNLDLSFYKKIRTPYI